MLALVAGTGGLPAALVARLPEKPFVCALDGFLPDVVSVDLIFRIEHLGTLLNQLTEQGITQVCFAGAVKRPEIDLAEIDVETFPLIGRIAQAIGHGDDGALRIIMTLFEDRGLQIRAAHDIAADLLPQTGIPTKAAPQASHHTDATVGENFMRVLGAADQGQACIVRGGRITAAEGPDGTQAMLATASAPYAHPDARDPLTFAADAIGDLLGSAADWLSGEGQGDGHPTTAGGILFKAPKPDQDLRADLPLIGPATATQAAQAGLDGIVIAASRVMVLDQPTVIEILDINGMFLWVRPQGANGAA